MPLVLQIGRVGRPKGGDNRQERERRAPTSRPKYLRTLGGHRRFPDRGIRALLETLSQPASADQPGSTAPSLGHPGSLDVLPQSPRLT